MRRGRWCRTRNGRTWSRWSRRVGPRVRRSRRICGAPSRPSSGAMRMEPSGGPSPPSWGPGRGRLRPSSAGPTWACGSGCCSWPKSVGPRAWGSTRDDVSRWHQHSGAPQGGGRGKKGATSKGRDEREALGRSRGGSGTKACVIADGLGRAVAFILAPGQAHELPHAVPLLERLPGVPKWVVADRGLSSHAFREHVWTLGARPAIPSKTNEAPVACREWVYNNRHRVENLWARLKEWRAIATRYEKPASSFMGVLCLAAALDWLKT